MIYGNKGKRVKTKENHKNMTVNQGVKGSSP